MVNMVNFHTVGSMKFVFVFFVALNVISGCNKQTKIMATNAYSLSLTVTFFWDQVAAKNKIKLN